MKIPVILLAAIVLSCSLAPCWSEDCCYDEITTHDANQDQVPGACSPFFTCGYCAGFIQPASYTVIEMEENISATYFDREMAQQLPDYTRSLFQPPRVNA